jgi:hypothetical protein
VLFSNNSLEVYLVFLTALKVALKFYTPRVTSGLGGDPIGSMSDFLSVVMTMDDDGSSIVFILPNFSLIG